MNTGKNYNKVVYGSGIEKIKAQISVFKGWLLHPKMRESHRLANRPKIIQYIDFLFSIIFYGTTLEDYLTFEFYNKNHKERKSYVTGRKLHKFFDNVNNKERTNIFIDKVKFAEYFSEYLGREIFKLELDGKNIDNAKSWLREMDLVFAKPSRGVEGKGVTRLVVGEDVEETIKYCLNNNLDLIEEAIVQHPKMNLLYPDSINSIRFITLVENNEVKLLGASLRIGNGRYVDNVSQGGVFASIDITNGKVDSKAFNILGEKFENHPITNHPIEGFQIPFWADVVEMCKSAALEFPDVRCVGWDVAISERGPLLIEGNDRWGRFVWQLPKEQGLYHMIKDY